MRASVKLDATWICYRTNRNEALFLWRSYLPIRCPWSAGSWQEMSKCGVRLKEKMEEYMANGVLLGWLLEPQQNRATIYRAGHAPQEIERPGILAGDPVLPGFRFAFKEIL